MENKRRGVPGGGGGGKILGGERGGREFHPELSLVSI